VNKYYVDIDVGPYFKSIVIRPRNVAIADINAISDDLDLTRAVRAIKIHPAIRDEALISAIIGAFKLLRKVEVDVAGFRYRIPEYDNDLFGPDRIYYYY